MGCPLTPVTLCQRPALRLPAAIRVPGLCTARLTITDASPLLPGDEGVARTATAVAEIAVTLGVPPPTVTVRSTTPPPAQALDTTTTTAAGAGGAVVVPTTSVIGLVGRAESTLPIDEYLVGLKSVETERFAQRSNHYVADV